jgi:hypothetical protein
MVHRLHAAVAVRLRELTTPERRDLGEGPVPYIIMVALIAGAAAAIGLALVAIANGWLSDVPRS